VTNRNPSSSGTPLSCYDKAVELLALRPHFRRELATKLAQRRFPPEEVIAALDRLTEQGYLDDRATARRFVESRVELRGEGRHRLRGELLKRGVAAGLAEETLAELLPEDDLEAARESAGRYMHSGRRGPEALGRHLTRKGYSRRAIVQVLRELPDSPEIDEEDLGSEPE
jgi:regulatory protein